VGCIPHTFINGRDYIPRGFEAEVFLPARCPSCQPKNTVRALKVYCLYSRGGGNNGVLVIYQFPARKSIAVPPRGPPWGCRRLNACSAKAAMGLACVALGAVLE